jgi:hypothetical protein
VPGAASAAGRQYAETPGRRLRRTRACRGRSPPTPPHVIVEGSALRSGPTPGSRAMSSTGEPIDWHLKDETRAWEGSRAPLQVLRV